MQPGSSRKVTVVILLVLTLALGVVAFVVASKLRESQAPEDTQASGFGPSATRDLYDDVEELFANTSCEKFLNASNANAIIETTDSDVSEMSFTVTGEEPIDLKPKICRYEEEPDKYIDVVMQAYDADSYVYDSETEKIALLNMGLISEVLDQGAYPALHTKYYFGTYAGSRFGYQQTAPRTDMCAAIIYQDANDFEYVSLIYSGYNCNDTVAQNKVIMETMSIIINMQMTYTYTKANVNPY